VLLVLLTALKNDSKIIESDEIVMESSLMNIWFIVGSIDPVFRERESEAFSSLAAESIHIRSLEESSCIFFFLYYPIALKLAAARTPNRRPQTQRSGSVFSSSNYSSLFLHCLKKSRARSFFVDLETPLLAQVEQVFGVI
jgi:hypothetical protein